MRQTPKTMAGAEPGPGNSSKNFALNPECSGTASARTVAIRPRGLRPARSLPTLRRHPRACRALKPWLLDVVKRGERIGSTRRVRPWIDPDRPRAEYAAVLRAS